ncbi:STAS domain-containing protein [Actinoplanes friuliensis]|jgi:anti-anti-sigma factor|uniref:STAS domain-containing protein n=1 Tax=Actinoplanes friuliensis DSM 7358 TaxID=1246995 RepID=U5VXY0_9ACTN|nr:STAS domain-containing protein [Actinoplanes friuliensis]AGZ41739.1 hypothetical protein AFR_17305 [Actinoplanes friuliensis DSM 7358]
MRTLLAITEQPGPAGALVLSATGELDGQTGVDLGRSVGTAARRPEVREIILLLTAVTFLDAGGLTALIGCRSATAALDVRFRVRDARGVVSRVLDITGPWPWAAG